MEEGTSGSRRTRSQVAPDWTIKDCLILVNEIAAVESDCSNALSSFQKWTMISENCNTLDVHRTLNQCRRKWDSLVSDHNQIKQWESQKRGSGDSYWSMSIEKRKKLNLPGDVDNELLEAINAVVMVQDNKAGTEPDSDPEAQEGFDVLDATAELAFVGSKRQSRQRTMVVVKENPPHKRKAEEEPHRNRVLESILNQRAKANNQKKTLEEKKPVVEISTDEEEEEETLNIEAMEAKLGETADLIHEIVGRNLAKGSETGDSVSIEDKMKFVRQQGDDLIAYMSEIVNTLNRLSEVPQ